MGRTQRKRRQTKRRHKFRSCDHEIELLLLNSWLSKQGVRRNKKLVLAVFDNTGRGVLTKKKISSGEELINLPLNSTMNVITLLTDIPFCNLFLKNKKPCLSEYKKSVTFQSLFAFYLSYLKLLGTDTKWHMYLDSLPKEYTVPYFLPNSMQCEVDSDIYTVISKQKEIITNSYNIFENVLQSCSEDDKLQNLKENFQLGLYEWAYFTVNTRCVYMDLTKVVDLKNIDNTILILVNDNTKISLCPYLDMINHSPNAKNETKLVVKNIEDIINVKNLNQDVFSDVWFSIYTKDNFEAFTEVFICYGDSHNLKLVTEYGFFLPENDLDYVVFSFDSIIEYLNSRSQRLSQEQSSFIISHGLNKDLYIDFRGLSFNLYGLLMVVKYYYDQSMNVGRLIYSAAVCSNNEDLNDMLRPMVRVKLENIKLSIRKLKDSGNKSVVLSNCVGLMSQYVNILEKFIKC